jgi:hypothetical protein
MAHIDARADAELQVHQMSWEQTRWLGAIILQPHVKKGRNVKPHDLIELPWDKKKPKAESDAEKAEKEAKRKAMFDKWDADIKKKTHGE